MRHSHRDLVGVETIEFLRQFYFDFGIIGCGGLDEEMGVLDFDPEEAAISRVHHRTKPSQCACLRPTQMGP